jgi:predicted aspartyl protease
MISRIMGRVTLTIGGRSVEVETLFDTGATGSFVDVGVAEKLGYTRFDKRFPANGISVSGVGPWCGIICFTHTS